MKIRFWGFIAVDIAAMCVIARAASFRLTMALVIILLLTNIVLAMVFRHISSSKASSSGHTISLLRSSTWDQYIPVVGGMICIFVGVFEFSWKPCVVGIVAIAIGFWRIWARGRVQQAIRNRH